MKPTRLQIEENKRKVAIVYRIHTEKAVKAASAVTNWLKKHDYEVFTAPEQKKIAGTHLMKSAREFQKMALVVVLGGDGTYLRAARLMQTYQIPILGFNMGTLGYLAHHAADKITETLEKTLHSEMCVQNRSRLQVTVLKKGKKSGPVYTALNDVVLERGSNSQLIHVAIDLDDNPVQEVKADGFILSTPTGSTAYNLAAGGPILDPEVESFVITPVAPHSLTHRPLVVPNTKIIKLKMKSVQAHLVVDGQKVIDVKCGDELCIEKAEIDHQLVIAKNHNDYNLLKKKLLFGSKS
jgi:NAD+ kinase